MSGSNGINGCSTTQTLAISSGTLQYKDLSKTNVRLDICLCTEHTTGSSRERGDEAKFHSSGSNYLDSLLCVFIWIYNANHSFLYPWCLFSSPLPSFICRSHPKWPVVSWSPVNEEVDLLARHQYNRQGEWNPQKPAGKKSVCIPKKEGEENKKARWNEGYDKEGEGKKAKTEEIKQHL